MARLYELDMQDIYKDISVYVKKIRSKLSLAESSDEVDFSWVQSFSKFLKQSPIFTNQRECIYKYFDLVLKAMSRDMDLVVYLIEFNFKIINEIIEKAHKISCKIDNPEFKKYLDDSSNIRRVDAWTISSSLAKEISTLVMKKSFKDEQYYHSYYFINKQAFLCIHSEVYFNIDNNQYYHIVNGNFVCYAISDTCSFVCIIYDAASKLFRPSLPNSESPKNKSGLFEGVKFHEYDEVIRVDDSILRETIVLFDRAVYFVTMNYQSRKKKYIKLSKLSLDNRMPRVSACHVQEVTKKVTSISTSFSKNIRAVCYINNTSLIMNLYYISADGTLHEHTPHTIDSMAKDSPVSISPYTSIHAYKTQVLVSYHTLEEEEIRESSIRICVFKTSMHKSVLEGDLKTVINFNYGNMTFTWSRHKYYKYPILLTLLSFHSYTIHSYFRGKLIHNATHENQTSFSHHIYKLSDGFKTSNIHTSYESKKHILSVSSHFNHLEHHLHSYRLLL